ncbi:hypothetical protein PQX77_020248 [Marasmius sp. AFHP31]|nr:hypothetical protein PQX77_020248 [Marasmius sp. AFHP31]
MHIFYDTRMLDISDTLAKWTMPKIMPSRGPKQGSAGAAEGVGKVLPFRVGPWVSYEPPPSSSSLTSSFSVMDPDVDMDAPQISTLRDEQTPPPQKASNPRFKLKLVVKDKTKTITSSSAGKSNTRENEEGEEEDEDQEDQLIDDDDGPIPAASLAAGSKRKSGAASLPASSSGKRKARKSEHGKRSEAGEGQGKLKEKVVQQPGAPNLAPTLSWFQANPATEHLEDSGAEGRIKIAPEDTDTPLSLPPSTKKKAAPKKAPAKKPKASAKLKLIPPMLPPEDTVSEAGMTGTAASSPVGMHGDDYFSPEPEAALPPSNIHLDPSEPAPTAQVAEQPINLEGVPIPVYPLPTKPFPVLPPPKISTGFAPNVPLDKTKAKVRRWRVANREIRGIGGGRWFTRAWVGEKESDLANVLAAGKAANAAASGSEAASVGGNGASSAKGAGGATSISAPPKAKKKGAAASRAGSSIPEPGTVASARGPSKMRITQMAPPDPPAPSSEAGDVDMVGSTN